MTFATIASNRQSLLYPTRRCGRAVCLAPARSKDDWLKTTALSPWLSLTAQSLQAMRRTGIGPAYSRLSRTDVRYRYGDVIAWIAGSIIDPASYTGKKGINLVAPKKLQIDKRSVDLIQCAPGKCSDDLFTPGQLCSWWGISQSLLERARHVGYGPSYIKISRNRVMYRRGDLLQYLRARAAAYVSEYAVEGVA